MTIQTIGARSVALYLTPADLRAHGAAPDTLTEELTQKLTRRACLEAGIALEGPVELESFPESCGVLVFARFRLPRRIWFAFSNLESLLTATRALGSHYPEGDLLWCDETYYLALPADAEQAACRLSEFARIVKESPLLEARLAEYGRTLLTDNALKELLRYFPDPMGAP